MKRFGDLDTEMIKRAITEWKSYFEFDNIFEVFPSIAIRLYRDRVEYWRKVGDGRSYGGLRRGRRRRESRNRSAR